MGARNETPPDSAASAVVRFRVPGPARTWTVLCLGDSITACSGAFACYRVALAGLLAESGIHIRFVGSQESDSPFGKLRHEGYGGRTAEFLADNIERLYAANPADIILLHSLLHSGHNHFVEEHPVPGFPPQNPKLLDLNAADQRVIFRGRELDHDLAGRVCGG